jgi:two-component system chemotaxis sensor kinase CheA/two-component system sensor histidine kinase and response regulator WspE
MGVTDEIRQKLLPRFRETTTDRVEKVSSALLELERGGAAPEPLAEVARELHTLKGEARMMGFAGLAALAHAAEDLLKAAGPAPDKARLQALLEACDAVRPLLDQPPDGGRTPGAAGAAAGGRGLRRPSSPPPARRENSLLPG